MKSQDLLLTTKNLADRYDGSTRTPERWRTEGNGPKFIRIGRKVFYRLRDVEEWEEANAFASTAEADRARRK